MDFSEYDDYVPPCSKRSDGGSCVFITNEKTGGTICKFCKRVGASLSDEIEPPCSGRQDGGSCVFLEDEKNAEMVCKFCGKIGRRILSTAQPKVFDRSDEKNLHAEQDTDSIQNPTLGNVFTSDTGSLNPGLTGCDRTLAFTRKKSAKDKLAEEWRRELQSQCGRMMLKARTTKECVELFNEYVKMARTLPKKKRNTIMLGIIFYACKNNSDQRTILELARQTKTSEKEVRAGMKMVEKKCFAFMDKRKVEPMDLIPRYCKMMKPEIRDSFIANASIVAEHIHQFLEGKKPSTVAATDIVLTFKWFYNGIADWSEADVADMAKLKLTTLKNSVAKVEKEMRSSGLSVAAIIADAERAHPTE